VCGPVADVLYFQDFYRGALYRDCEPVQWSKESFRHWVLVFDFANCPVCVLIRFIGVTLLLQISLGHS